MMKRIYIILLACMLAMGAYAQKLAGHYAVVDIAYILKNLPQYESANEQLALVSKKWQREVDQQLQEVQTLYKDYQTELVFLSEDMKTKRQQEILAKEKAVDELKRKYFGQEGELFKKREALIKPIQDEIYTAIQDLSKEKGYDMVIDKSSTSGLIYTGPKLDISDMVLQKLGITK